MTEGTWNNEERKSLKKYMMILNNSYISSYKADSVIPKHKGMKGVSTTVIKYTVIKSICKNKCMLTICKNIFSIQHESATRENHLDPF